jgi:hypothetical protein
MAKPGKKPRRGLRNRLGLESEEERRRWDDRLALIVGAVAVVVILAAAAGAIAMSVQMYRHGPIQATGNPLAPIFASRLMVGAARLAVLFIGVFIVLSILMHMRRGQWLTAAGPFKVSQAARRVASQVERKTEQLRQVTGENDRLKTTVSNLTTEVRTLEKLLAQAQIELRRRRTSG